MDDDKLAEEMLKLLCYPASERRAVTLRWPGVCHGLVGCVWGAVTLRWPGVCHGLVGCVCGGGHSQVAGGLSWSGGLCGGGRSLSGGRGSVMVWWAVCVWGRSLSGGRLEGGGG